MNKKIIALALFTTLTFGFTACSSDDSNSTQTERITVDQLPENTKQFVNAVFPDANIVQANKVNKPNYYGSFYKLVLNNNIEIDFDREGNWTEIETKNNTAIPADFLAQEVPLIQAYVAEHYKANFIVEIDKNRRGYEVKLNSGLELIFDANQVFVGIDMDIDDDEQLIDYRELPANAQQVLQTHFPTSEVVLIKKESDSEGTSYEVYTNEGFKIEFDQQGEWKEIETKQGKDIPSALIPTPITTYIQANYAEYKLTTVEKKPSVFEVEIKNGRQELDLIFDRQGNFIKIDR